MKDNSLLIGGLIGIIVFISLTSCDKKPRKPRQPVFTEIACDMHGKVHKFTRSNDVGLGWWRDIGYDTVVVEIEGGGRISFPEIVCTTKRLP